MKGHCYESSSRSLTILSFGFRSYACLGIKLVKRICDDGKEPWCCCFKTMLFEGPHWQVGLNLDNQGLYLIQLTHAICNFNDESHVLPKYPKQTV